MGRPRSVGNSAIVLAQNISRKAWEDLELLDFNAAKKLLGDVVGADLVRLKRERHILRGNLYQIRRDLKDRGVIFGADRIPLSEQPDNVNAVETFEMIGEFYKILDAEMERGKAIKSLVQTRILCREKNHGDYPMDDIKFGACSTCRSVREIRNRRSVKFGDDRTYFLSWEEAYSLHQDITKKYRENISVKKDVAKTTMIVSHLMDASQQANTVVCTSKMHIGNRAVSKDYISANKMCKMCANMYTKRRRLAQLGIEPDNVTLHYIMMNKIHVNDVVALGLEDVAKIANGTAEPFDSEALAAYVENLQYIMQSSGKGYKLVKNPHYDPEFIRYRPGVKRKKFFDSDNNDWLDIPAKTDVNISAEDDDGMIFERPPQNADEEPDVIFTQDQGFIDTTGIYIIDPENGSVLGRKGGDVA